MMGPNKLSYLLVILLLATICIAQNESGIIRPGETHTNETSQNEYFLPESKVIDLLKTETKADFDALKIEKYKELLAEYQEKDLFQDSLATIARIEADIWHQKLQNNDQALEEQRKINIQLVDDNNKIRKSRIYYFFAGVVATAIVVIAVK